MYENQPFNISTYKVISKWLARRIETLVGSTNLKDVVISLCSMDRINELETVLLNIAGNSSMPEKLLLYPIDDVIDSCICKDKDNKLVVIFKTKIKNDIVGVTIVFEPLHLRPATLSEIQDENHNSNSIEIKTI